MFLWHVVGGLTSAISFLFIILDDGTRSHGTAIGLFFTISLVSQLLTSILSTVVSVNNKLALILNTLQQSNEISVNKLNVVNQEFYNVNDSLNRIAQQTPPGSTNP